MKNLRRTLMRCATAGALVLAAAGPAAATHSWNNYHWARTANPFTLKVGDSVGSAWDASLDGAIADWSQSTVLDLTKVAGTSNPRNCKGVTGQVEVCNAAYGFNGWLGIAQISVSGSHITKGVVKLNDSYFNTPTYNTPAWRNLVTCQEIGHTFGLDHQDEAFDNPNLGTCMDYTNDPSTNQHPNQHDYDELVIIYSHNDSTTTIASTPGNSAFGQAQADGDTPSEWGRAVAFTRDGRGRVFERDLGGDRKVITFVTWVSNLVVY